jgi:hypothetical protein
MALTFLHYALRFHSEKKEPLSRLLSTPCHMHTCCGINIAFGQNNTLLVIVNLKSWMMNIKAIFCLESIMWKGGKPVCLK